MVAKKVPFILKNIKSEDPETFGKEVFKRIQESWPGVKLIHSELRDETSEESRERFKGKNPATAWHKDGLPSYLIALKVLEGPGTIYHNPKTGEIKQLEEGQTIVIGAMGYEHSNGHKFEATKHKHPGPDKPRKILRAEFIPWNKRHKYYKLQEELTHPDYCGQFFENL